MIHISIHDRQLKIMDATLGVELYPRGALAGAVVESAIQWTPGQPAQVHLILDAEEIEVNSFETKLGHTRKEGDTAWTKYAADEIAKAVDEEVAKDVVKEVQDSNATVSVEVVRKPMGRDAPEHYPTDEEPNERTLGDRSPTLQGDK